MTVAENVAYRLNEDGAAPEEIEPRVKEVLRFVEQAEVGMVHVNQPTVGGEAQLPFGGIKATGVGEKEMAEEGANFFTHLKTVWLDYTRAKRTTNIY